MHKALFFRRMLPGKGSGWHVTCKLGRYRNYSDALRAKYGEKVYKVPVALPVTCPNRDGLLDREGCIFCGSIGADYETAAVGLPITAQLDRSMAHIGPKYKARKFIAYFQNFTNTYAPPDEFRRWMEEAARHPAVVELDVSTRPDCIHEVYLDILRDVAHRFDVNITIELGLQTANPHTLAILRREHTAAECIDAALRIGRYGFGLCVHVIADLPWDDRVDVVETAKLISVLPVTQVKLHSLYLVKGTRLAEMHAAGEVRLLPAEEYAERVLLFLEYLREDILVQRLVGRASGPLASEVNGGRPWWEVRRHIEEEMVLRDIRQGDRCDYLGGKAVRRWTGGGEEKKE